MLISDDIADGQASLREQTYHHARKEPTMAATDLVIETHGLSKTYK
jgi:hypothetical protein